ncbi:hypothetical protein KGM_202801 [Danaus plexippus plexippus]|uniref:Uncharacterized protein n=1 Tax=Danaus plexippus plexippus TaxID=278856 RepID=A0A212ETB1_DANPL|nr:hypothetical protein KGM_202801 [Danaus plexippus plexippus]
MYDTLTPFEKDLLDRYGAWAIFRHSTCEIGEEATGERGDCAYAARRTSTPAL